MWYCGADCQKQDWNKHKQFCKDAQARQTLVRAAAILQEAWYIFTRITNMWAFDRIEKEGSMWLLHHPQELPGKSYLMPFPPVCIKTEEEELAVLSFNKCVTSMHCIHGLAKPLLQGIYPCSPTDPTQVYRVGGTDLAVGFTHEVSEVQCYVKNQRIRLAQVFQINGEETIDRTNYKHAILKITLKNMEQYALDLTCAQYGWPESIMPWDAYEVSRIQSIVKTSEFGSGQKDFRAGPSQNGRLIHIQYGIMDEFGRAVDNAVNEYRAGPSQSGRLIHIQYGVMGEFGRAVDNAVNEYRLILVKPGRLRFSEDKFTAEKRALLECIRLRLEKVKAKGEESEFFQRSLLTNPLSYLTMRVVEKVVL